MANDPTFNDDEGLPIEGEPDTLGFNEEGDDFEVDDEDSEEVEDFSVPTQRSSNEAKVTGDHRFFKGELFRLLNAQIPLNEYHIPEYIYRADLIPPNLNDYPAKVRNQFCEAATLHITFDHGYPAILETKPFWEQLPSEPYDAFNAFMVYLELPEKSNHQNPIRILPMIATLVGQPIEVVTEWCHMFYWHYRSRSYDLFIIACHRKQREQRIMSIEGKHFKQAEEYLEKVDKIIRTKLDLAINAIGSKDDDGSELDDIKLKEVVDIFERLAKIQRISVGLPANGATQIDTGLRHATINDELKQVVKDSVGEATTATRRPAEMDKLLDNPEDLARIQDLITRHQAGA